MARRNPLEKALDHVTDDFRRRLLSVKSSNPKAVPLGEQEVSPREFREAYPEMSRADIQKVLDKHGQAAFLEQLKGR